MEILFFHLPISIIISLTILGLGILVYFRERRSVTNKTFFFLSLTTTIWVISLYLIDHPFFITTPLFWGRVTMAAGFSIGASLLYFILVFPQKKIKLSLFWKITLLIYSVFIFLSLFTGLIVKEIEFKEWGANPVGGKLYFLYPLLFVFPIGVTIFFLLKKYKRSRGIEKLQLQYFSIGLFLFLVGSAIFNMAIPIITGSAELAKFGPYFCIFLIGYTALAITRYHLFEIRVILTEILVGAIAIILFVQIFTAPTTLWRITNSLIFILFVIFGYLLIRATLREIKMRQEIERIDRAKSEFISIASHQLRTPLTAIKGYISMILEGTYGQISERAMKPMANVYQSNERLIKLVNDLLNLSRLEVGKIEFNPQPTSLKELISGIIEELKINAEKRGLYLKLIEVKKPLPEVIVDRDKLRQVILNIIDNAIKYTQKGGITIELEKINNEERIRISDTGEGMTKGEIDSLFQMFSRATAGSQLRIEGAGLGLYVAKRFIEMHSGKIWAESEGKGKGSTFSIQLPIKLDEKLLKIKTKEITRQGSDIF